MFQDINLTQLHELQDKGAVTLIDVRSPMEFGNSTIPGSINIPLFDDQERAEIGTLYTQVSSQAAKDRGLEIVSAKLPAFVKAFGQIDNRKVLYCWRGGMRSKTSATILSLMDIHVYRLEGGIRAYRKWVMDTLEAFEFRPQACVLNGNTGSGKTAILQRLQEQGYPVIDFEKIAGHRGSIFGHIGLKANNQKTFESLLLHDLLRVNDSPYVVLEAESKRVGKVVLPEFLCGAKENGIQFIVQLPMAERIRNILEEYRPEERKAECILAFEAIKQRIHTPVASEIEKHLQIGNFAEAVHLLLVHYYDPRYEHAMQKQGEDGILIRANDVDQAADMVKLHLHSLKR